MRAAQDWNVARTSFAFAARNHPWVVGAVCVPVMQACHSAIAFAVQNECPSDDGCVCDCGCGCGCVVCVRACVSTSS